MSNSQDATKTTCRCGRSWVFTGRWASHNGKDIDDRLACQECVLDAIYARFNTSREAENATVN